RDWVIRSVSPNCGDGVGIFVDSTIAITRAANRISQRRRLRSSGYIINAIGNEVTRAKNIPFDPLQAPKQARKMKTDTNVTLLPVFEKYNPTTIANAGDRKYPM
ncbi:MAG: hypothetical protein ABW107_15160, partial [Candidatus Thiodiazotropha sp. 6PLUC5]